ncbi:MAG: hypothetical protein NWE89_04715 [Candidatus Bathyarchaeota archaeon]|nr:hypothetical protein [Candidatus Bathyarchaeota archaeon]
MPRIDLLIRLDDHIEIIEAKAQPKLKDVSELIFYQNALEHDERYDKYKSLPWKLIFITLDDQKSIEIYCESFGIQYIYVPEHKLPKPDYVYGGGL